MTHTLPAVPRFRVPQYSDEDLTRLACRHYNDNLRQRGLGRPMLLARPTSDQAFLDRLRVNYLRHHVSERLFPRGVILPDETYRQLQMVLYQAIAEAYPRLWYECKRQLARKVDRE